MRCLRWLYVSKITIQARFSPDVKLTNSKFPLPLTIMSQCFRRSPRLWVFFLFERLNCGTPINERFCTKLLIVRNLIFRTSISFRALMRERWRSRTSYECVVHVQWTTVTKRNKNIHMNERHELNIFKISVNKQQCLNDNLLVNVFC